MKTLVTTIIVSTLTCSGILYWWLNYTPQINVQYAGYTQAQKINVNAKDTLKIGEFFKCFEPAMTNTSSEKGEAWPNFRGTHYDNIYKSEAAANNLSEEFEVIWEIDLGEGHAAAAVYNQRVYLLDYLEEEKADALRCFDLATGVEIWRRWTRIDIKRNHGKSRTIPAVYSNVVVTISPKCQVMCVNKDTGKLLWKKDLPSEYNTEIPMWYTGQCPLIDKGEAIIAVGSDDILIAAFDTITGKEKWHIKNPYKIRMSHSSIIPMTILGKKCFIYAGIGGITAFSAEQKDRGKELWTFRGWAPNVVAPSPIQRSDDTIFCTAGYGEGSAIIKVYNEGSEYRADLLEKYSPQNGICLEQQSPIIYKDHIFAILPKDAGELRTQLVAAHLNAPQKILFNSGKEYKFGLGPFMIINDKIFALEDRGKLSVFDFSADKGFTHLHSQQVIKNGHDAWGPMATADGYLILRDSKKMVCLKLK